MVLHILIRRPLSFWNMVVAYMAAGCSIHHANFCANTLTYTKWLMTEDVARIISNIAANVEAVGGLALKSAKTSAGILVIDFGSLGRKGPTMTSFSRDLVGHFGLRYPIIKGDTKLLISTEIWQQTYLILILHSTLYLLMDQVIPKFAPRTYGYRVLCQKQVSRPRDYTPQIL